MEMNGEENMKIFIRACLVSIFLLNYAMGQEKIDEASLLMQLDRDFDKATAEKRIDGWIAYFAPNGSMISDTSEPIVGPAEIRKAMEPAFKDSTFSLRWQPTKAEIMIPGVLGCTVGRYEQLRKRKTGKLMKSSGTYASIWMKQLDGSWKIVLDTGNSDGPPVEVN
jgi:ketosteroid isomerase-like protein